MQSGGDRGPAGVEEQLASKQTEWKELLCATAHQLKKAKEECFLYRTRYERLREDFQFNLALLDERDRELERYDVLTGRAQKHSSCMADEARRLTMNHEKMKSELQNRIHELERQLSAQRQEVTAAFQNELRQQKHDFNVKIDELCAAEISRDLKVKLLCEETEVSRQTLIQNTEDLKASRLFCEQLQTQLLRTEQHMENVTAVKDCRINHLEDKLKWMEAKLKHDEDEFIKKYQDVIQSLKACELQLEERCRVQTHHLQKAEQQIVKLQQAMEVLREAIKQKEKTIQRCEQQLSASLERQKNLEVMRLQVELEWQKRCENMKTEPHHVNEQLIEDLIRHRDQVKEELKKKDKELQELAVLAHSANTREQAAQCLTPTEDSGASEEISCLKEQNSVLRAVVSQMRKDMEAFLPQSQASSPQSGLCPKNHPQMVCLMKQDVKEPHSIEQRAQVQEKNQSFRQQQQCAGLMSGDVSENLQGVRNKQPVQHIRLKQAAFCIARLIKEKQQLIDIGNRLRGMISTAGFKGNNPYMEHGEKPGQQNDRLRALEQLQYQLTSQEAQHAVGQRAATQSLNPGTTYHHPATNLPSQETDKPESSKDQKRPELIHAQNSVHTEQLSSESLQSLNDLWDMLDHDLTSSVLSEGDGELNRTEVADAAGVQMIVCGITAPIHDQPLATIQQRKKPCVTLPKTTKTRKINTRIRNYNIKD